MGRRRYIRHCEHRRHAADEAELDRCVDQFFSQLNAGDY
jgi:hypothetical protein